MELCMELCQTARIVVCTYPVWVRNSMCLDLMETKFTKAKTIVYYPIGETKIFVLSETDNSHNNKVRARNSTFSRDLGGTYLDILRVVRYH